MLAIGEEAVVGDGGKAVGAAAGRSGAVSASVWVPAGLPRQPSPPDPRCYGQGRGASRAVRHDGSLGPTRAPVSVAGMASVGADSDGPAVARGGRPWQKSSTARSRSSPAATPASARRSCWRLAEAGRELVIDYVANPEATEDAREASRRAGRAGGRRRGRRVQGRRPPEARRRGRLEFRASRHPGEQRRHRDPDVRPRHDRGAVREGPRDQPQERLLRHPDRGQADDHPGRGRPDHQHDVRARGLADARQHRRTACPRAACAC